MATARVVNVHTEYKDASGVPLTGSLVFAPCREFVDGDVLVAATSISAPLTGVVALAATDVPYMVRERVDGVAERRFIISLDPAKPDVNLVDLGRECVRGGCCVGSGWSWGSWGSWWSCGCGGGCGWRGW